MKKTLVVIACLVLTIVGRAQTVQGSIQQGSSPNKADIVYLPDHNSVVGEYVSALSVSVSIPTSLATGVAPTIASAGIFSPLSFTPSVPFSYTFGAETIYSWIVTNNTSFTMSWSSGVSFVGATITFSGGTAASKVKLVDLSNLESGGGGNGNSYFGIGVNVPPFDVTNYSNFFFSLGGGNSSTTGMFGNGDRYVETDLLISLPVNLLNFSGYKNGSKNTLNWTVASEVNNMGFDVQRSTDGTNYTSIGFVNSLAPGGYTNSETRYTFDDDNPVGKKQYYRLNQKDIDGHSKLSNVVVINGDKPKTLEIGGLFPNPASTIVNVLIETPKRDNVTIVMTDMTGKTVKQQLANVDIGSNTVQVDVSNLAGGSYLVKLLCKTLDCETAAAKFNKQ